MVGELLRFDGRIPKKRHAYNEKGSALHSLKGIMSENYIIDDEQESLSLVACKRHIPKTMLALDPRPEELQQFTDFNGQDDQMLLVIPTPLQFTNVAELYVQQYNCSPILFARGEKGASYNGAFIQEMAPPYSMYATATMKHLQSGKPVLSRSFTMEDLLNSNESHNLGLLYDVTRDVGLCHYLDPEEEDYPVWTLEVYLPEFDSLKMQFFIKQFCSFDVPPEKLMGLIQHAKLMMPREKENENKSE